jgi:hypothetical protein
MTHPDRAHPASPRFDLGALAEVFAPPPIDLFAGLQQDRPGIARLEAFLAGRRKGHMPDRLDWVVPAAEATPAAAAALRRAVEGWCAAQSMVVREDLAALAVERRQAVIVGGAFFVVCFALAAGFEASGAGESLGIGLLTESFVIAGWVGLWHAVELVLHAPWPLKARLRRLERIAAMEHRVVSG